VNKRVIVVGFDGLEPAIVDSLLARGELPNFDRIRRAGAYTSIRIYLTGCRM